MRRFSKTLILSVAALSLALSGCSGDDGADQSGPGGGSTQASPTSADTPTEETTMGRTSTGAAPQARTTAQGGSGGSTALSGGLEEARSQAESWNADAELYAIASLRPTVNLEGENNGWLYSFVSESTGSILSIPYRGGRVLDARGQSLPQSQIARLSDITLTADELIDSSEAMQRSDEVRSYLQENPEAGASAGLDFASREEPEWILIVPSEGLQDRVPAVE